MGEVGVWGVPGGIVRLMAGGRPFRWLFIELPVEYRPAKPCPRFPGVSMAPEYRSYSLHRSRSAADLMSRLASSGSR